MKKKTIEKELRIIFKQFIESITDTKLREQVKKNCYISGGAIVSMLNHEDVNDYDIYVKDFDTLSTIAKYYLDIAKKANSTQFEASRVVADEKMGVVNIVIPSAGIIRLEEKQYKNKKFFPIILTDNAITLTNKVQIVLRFHGTIEEIHKNYDFVHVTNYWESDTGKLHLNQKAMESITTRELFYQGSLFPVASLVRLRKFIQKGWTITAGEMFKIIYQCSLLDLRDFDVLRDQLLGVDMAYFSEFVHKLSEWHKEQTKGKKEIDPTEFTSYLFSLLDIIFNDNGEYEI